MNSTTPSGPQSLRILLAEDSPVNQKVALHMLKQIGYQADVVADGEAVLKALQSQPYDVILMDLQMPQMDGLEAARQIQAQWPPNARPCIIAMTASSWDQEKEACLAAGMVGYVGKPVKKDALAEALGRCRPRSG